MNEEVRSTIKAMPKVELHLHLEGAIRYSTALQLSKSTDPNRAFNISEIKKTSRYNDLKHFVDTMRSVGDLCLRNHNDYRKVAYELFCDLDDSNVIYAEVSYDPARALRIGISPESIMEAVSEAKQMAEAERSIRIGLILGLSREYGPDPASAFISKVIGKSDHYNIIGMDLHGNEAAAAPSEFTAAFTLAREAGFGIRAHAGESREAHHIWDAIRQLKVSRIGHGIGALADESLQEYLAAHTEITLDMCPTSNYMLGLVTEYGKHPARRFFDKGIRISISTDDPLYFNTSLENEYSLLYEHCGFSIPDLRKVNRNAILGSFAAEEQKSELLRILEGAD